MEAAAHVHEVFERELCMDFVGMDVGTSSMTKRRVPEDEQACSVPQSKHALFMQAFSSSKENLLGNSLCSTPRSLCTRDRSGSVDEDLVLTREKSRGSVSFADLLSMNDLSVLASADGVASLRSLSVLAA